MSKYRICYSQGEQVRFISHLDFLRTITRTFKRAEVPVKYSEGFNPHMVMTIGLPLSVGTTSCCDCLDVELTEEADTDILKERINACAPDGIYVNEIKKSDSLIPLYRIDSAVYQSSFKTDIPLKLEDYISAPQVMTQKKSKRKIKEVNIKDFIRNIEVIDSDGINHCIKMHINAGNFSNLKPELVLRSMEEFFGCKISDTETERKEIYFDDMTRVF